jgi:hypothetical protein
VAITALWSFVKSDHHEIEARAVAIADKILWLVELAVPSQLSVYFS